MFTRDYILRMIEMLTAVLQEILMLKKTRNYKEASIKLNITAQKLIGLELNHIEKFTDSKIIELLSLEKDTAPIRLYVTGVLLREYASIKDLQSSENERQDVLLKSLSLLLESYVTDMKPLSSNHKKDIEEVIDLTKDDMMPRAVLMKMFLYYENSGRYGKAEDILFELIEADPSFNKKGLEFYERLLDKNDDELNSGNLPRDEVKESLLLLRSKVSGETDKN